MNQSSTLKVCTICNTDKPLEDFYAEKRGLYGRRSVCKTCEAEKAHIKRNALIGAKLGKPLDDRPKREYRRGYARKQSVYIEAKYLAAAYPFIHRFDPKLADIIGKTLLKVYPEYEFILQESLTDPLPVPTLAGVAAGGVRVGGESGEGGGAQQACQEGGAGVIPDAPVGAAQACTGAADAGDGSEVGVGLGGGDAVVSGGSGAIGEGGMVGDDDDARLKSVAEGGAQVGEVLELAQDDAELAQEGSERAQAALMNEAQLLALYGEDKSLEGYLELIRDWPQEWLAVTPDDRLDYFHPLAGAKRRELSRRMAEDADEYDLSI